MTPRQEAITAAFMVALACACLVVSFRYREVVCDGETIKAGPGQLSPPFCVRLPGHETVYVSFTADHPVSVYVIDYADFENFTQGAEVETYYKAEGVVSDSFSFTTEEKGVYAIVFDNRASGEPVNVKLGVWVATWKIHVFRLWAVVFLSVGMCIASDLVLDRFAGRR